MITPFTLPSNPGMQIRFREATVADAIDFADVDESHEEELTTLFLERIQTGAVTDPKEWTAEDRRFALYWYWLHTSKETEIALSYDCRHCGQNHVYLQNLRDVADRYTPIDGLPYRKTLWRDEPLIVHCLTGYDMEELDRIRLRVEATKGSESEKFVRTIILFESIVACVTFGDTVPDRKNRDDRDRKRIMAMSLNDFGEFAGIVGDLLAEMRHGLEIEYEKGRLFMVMPPHACPEGGGQTRVRYPFRNYDYIPGL